MVAGICVEEQFWETRVDGLVGWSFSQLTVYTMQHWCSLMVSFERTVSFEQGVDEGEN